jgi:tol-pal system protein YbgF
VGKKMIKNRMYIFLLVTMFAFGFWVSSAISPGSPTALGASGTAYSEEGMQRVYDRGMRAFKQKDYDEAIFWFEVYLDAFPESRLADNALYWRGEAYYSKKEYKAAAREFAEVLKRFPEGDKAKAAMLKLGLSYLEMGERAEGAKYLNKVISAYPGTVAARLAEKRLKNRNK